MPDIAELKLLRQLELDLIESVEQLNRLHPELSSETDLDALLLEDVSRLAYRHRRITELFELMRRRLGLPDPQ